LFSITVMQQSIGGSASKSEMFCKARKREKEV
jgi:hypothetical protein